MMPNQQLQWVNIIMSDSMLRKRISFGRFWSILSSEIIAKLLKCAIFSLWNWFVLNSHCKDCHEVKLYSGRVPMLGSALVNRIIGEGFPATPLQKMSKFVVAKSKLFWTRSCGFVIYAADNFWKTVLALWYSGGLCDISLCPVRREIY